MGATKKQTAVEWLESKLKGDEIFNLDVVIAKAKEMEKEQIIDCMMEYAPRSSAEIYYTETYENN